MGMIGEAAGVFGPQQQAPPDYQNAVDTATGSLDQLTPIPQPEPPFQSVTTTYAPDGTLVHSFKGMADHFVQKAVQGISVADQVQNVAPIIENRMQSLIAERDQYKALYSGQLAIAGQGAIQAQGAYGDAISGLRSKRDMLNANPLLAGIGRIASLAAANYAGGPQASRIAPAVHAAGAYGLDTFGQSPDNLNQQIAGLSSEAQAAQIPYTQLLEKSQAQVNTSIEHELKAEELKQNRADTLKLQRDKLEETKKTHLNSLESSFMSTMSANKAEPTDPSTQGFINTSSEAFKNDYIAAGGDSARADAIAKRGTAMASLGGTATANTEKGRNDRQNKSLAVMMSRIAQQNAQFNMTHADKVDKAAFDSLDLAGRKPNSKAAIDDLSGFKTVSDAIGTLGQKLRDAPGRVGPGAGQLTKLSEWLGTNNESGAALYHDMNQLLFVQGKIYGGGQALMRKYGLEQVKTIKPDLKMNPEMIQGLVGAINETLGNAYQNTSSKLNKSQIALRKELYPNDQIFKASLAKGIDPQSLTPYDLNKTSVNPGLYNFGTSGPGGPIAGSVGLDGVYRPAK